MPDIQVRNQTIRALEAPEFRAEVLRSLPTHRRNDAEASRIIRISRTVFLMRQELQNCSANSIQSSLLQAVQLGLEPNMLGHAYFVPYKRQCQLIVGYRGFMELARRSGDISSFSWGVVREGDEFEYSYGSHAFLKHVPRLNNSNKVRCTWAMAKFKSGGEVFAVVDELEIDRTRKRAPAAESGPWKTDTDKMRLKTAIRRLSPLLPQCPELQLAEELQGAVERQEPQLQDTPFIDVDAQPWETGDDAAADNVRKRIEEAKRPSPPEATPNTAAGQPPSEGEEGNTPPPATPTPAAPDPLEDAKQQRDAFDAIGSVPLRSIQTLNPKAQFRTWGVVSAVKSRDTTKGPVHDVTLSVQQDGDAAVISQTFAMWGSLPEQVAPGAELTVVAHVNEKKYQGQLQFTIERVEG